MTCAFANVSINQEVSYFLIWTNDYKRLLVQYEISDNGRISILKSISILDNGMRFVKENVKAS